MKPITKILILLSTLLLVGCSNELDLGAPAKPQHFVVEAPAVRAKALYALQSYRAMGAFSVKVKGSQRIVNFNWYHRGTKTYSLKLSTAGDFFEAVLKNYHGQITYWKDPAHFVRVRSLRNFMLAEMGWYIPLNDFFYWMRGVPLPGTHPTVKYDGFGHLLELTQAGWTIHYARYINYGDYDLPTMLRVTSPQGDQLRVAVKQWVLYNNITQNTKEAISKRNQQLLDGL